MQFKILIFAYCFFVAMTVRAQTSVPVSDTMFKLAYEKGNQNLIYFVNEGATKISTQLINSTEMLASQQDEIQRQQTAVLTEEFVQSERRRNAERFSPHMGGKVMPGCTSTLLAKTYTNGAKLRGQVRTASNRSIKDHTERNRHLSPSESVITSNSTTYLQRMKKLSSHQKNSEKKVPAPLVDNQASVSLVSGEDGISDYSATIDRYKFHLYPFPAKVNQDFDDPNQDPSQRAAGSKALLKMDMIRRIGEIGNNVYEKRAEVLSTDFITYMFPPGATEERNKMLGDRTLISHYGAMQAINRFRAMSPTWQKLTASNTTSMDSMMSDSNLMAAQSLMNDDAMISLLQDIVLLLSMQAAIDVQKFNPDVSNGNAN